MEIVSNDKVTRVTSVSISLSREWFKSNQYVNTVGSKPETSNISR